MTDEHPDAPELRTERLVLRAWRDADLEPFAALNADPVVMEHFPATLTRDESVAFVDVVTARWREGGPSWWAVEMIDGPSFIGFVGLAVVHFEAAFTPAVEVGWRLAHEHWGRGYAPEAAGVALRYGFEVLGLDEIVSFTVTANSNSRRVMEKLGMRHDIEGDFLHPALDPDDPLAAHVLYRITRAERTARAAVGPPPAGSDDGRS